MLTRSGSSSAELCCLQQTGISTCTCVRGTVQPSRTGNSLPGAVVRPFLSKPVSCVAVVQACQRGGPGMWCLAAGRRGQTGGSPPARAPTQPPGSSCTCPTMCACSACSTTPSLTATTGPATSGAPSHTQHHSQTNVPLANLFMPDYFPFLQGYGELALESVVFCACLILADLAQSLDDPSDTVVRGL